jgi:hypothetical protein
LDKEINIVLKRGRNSVVKWSVCKPWMTLSHHTLT